MKCFANAWEDEEQGKEGNQDSATSSSGEEEARENGLRVHCIHVLVKYRNAGYQGEREREREYEYSQRQAAGMKDIFEWFWNNFGESVLDIFSYDDDAAYCTGVNNAS